MASKTIDEEHIRTAAYYIWLQEGQPYGMEEHHWTQARAQLESGTDASVKAKPARRARKPKADTPATEGAEVAKPARRSSRTKAKA